MPAPMLTRRAASSSRTPTAFRPAPTGAVRDLARAPASTVHALDEVRPRSALSGHAATGRTCATQLHPLHRARGRASRPVLVGHSLGGFLSVMAAARHPDLARGVRAARLADPVGGWKARALQRRQAHRRRRAALARRTCRKRRRQHWPSARGGLRALRREAGVRALGAAACCATTSPAAPSRTRRTARRSSASRSTATSRRRSTTRCRTTSTRMLRAHPLRCPVAFVKGSQSTRGAARRPRGDRAPDARPHLDARGHAPLSDGKAARDRGRGDALDRRVRQRTPRIVNRPHARASGARTRRL